MKERLEEKKKQTFGGDGFVGFNRVPNKYTERVQKFSLAHDSAVYPNLNNNPSRKKIEVEFKRTGAERADSGMRDYEKQLARTLPI